MAARAPPPSMPLLLVPLLLLAVIVLWACLLPLALLNRYRRGRGGAGSLPGRRCRQPTAAAGPVAVSRMPR